MFGSGGVKLLQQLHDSTDSRAYSATRWDFTFPFYSVPVCLQISAWQVRRRDGWHHKAHIYMDDTWGEQPRQSFSTCSAPWSDFQMSSVLSPVVTGYMDSDLKKKKKECVFNWSQLWVQKLQVQQTENQKPQVKICLSLCQPRFLK